MNVTETSSAAPLSDVAHPAALNRPNAPKAKRAHSSKHSPEISSSSEDVLSADEKRFFEGLFPGSAQDIREHRVYTPDGARTNVAPGMLIDRRG